MGRPRDEVPQVAVERTVRLSWPESAVADSGLESASTVGGPWLPVITPALPWEMGIGNAGWTMAVRVFGWWRVP